MITPKTKKILISAAVSGFDGHIFKFNFKKDTMLQMFYARNSRANF